MGTHETTQSEWALGVAQSLLAKPLPKRWAQAQAAAEKAGTYAAIVPGEEEVLVSIAALHNVGFTEEARDTGFSTLDGALYLRKISADERLVDLLAHILVGSVEAELRGLGDRWAEFGPDEKTPLRDAFWTICLTTGPNGEEMTAAERCDEWLVRYAHLDYMDEYLERCRGELQDAEARTRERLDAAG